MPPAASTIRPSASATGRSRIHGTIHRRLFVCRRRYARRAGDVRRGRLGQPRSAGRAAARGKTNARSASTPRHAVSAPIWEAVLQDFSQRHAVGGLRLSINDAGATPAVVSLRLDQAFDDYRSARMNTKRRELVRSHGARAPRRSGGRRSFRRTLSAGGATRQPASGAARCAGRLRRRRGRRPRDAGRAPGAARRPGRPLQWRRGRRNPRREDARPARSRGARNVRLRFCCWSTRAACDCTRPMPG